MLAVPTMAQVGRVRCLYVLLCDGRLMLMVLVGGHFRNGLFTPSTPISIVLISVFGQRVVTLVSHITFLLRNMEKDCVQHLYVLYVKRCRMHHLEHEKCILFEEQNTLD